MKILVTGAAGFIGSFLVEKLCENPENYVVGIDNLNDYYDVILKESRLQKIKINKNFLFEKLDLVEENKLMNLFKIHQFDVVINLAAQAGVRYSIENPRAYIDSNIVGFLNILEAARHYPVKHLLFASSSSVYGGNKKVPFSTNDNVDHPVSLYAATKKSNELLAHSYANLYDIPVTGLRFFTVYGPMGRPDMAYYSFANKIMNNETIEVFNNGDMERDFTYVDDIVEGIIRLIEKAPESNNDWSESEVSSSWAPYQIFNIGNSNPVNLLTFIHTIEKYFGKEAKKVFKEMQPGDVKRTFADVSDLENLINFKPKTSLDNGIEKFVSWFKEYNNIHE